MGGGGGSGMSGSAHEVIQSLFDNHDLINREVHETDTGVEAYTYSDDFEVAGWLQEHVQQMKELMESGGRIRGWDDLFALAAEYHDLNQLSIQKEANGVRVVHAVNDNVDGDARVCITDLIHEHAGVVSNFVKKGKEEAMLNHEVPDTCAGF
jgi:hypothetical protein